MAKYYPLNPQHMAMICRRLAADLRREAAAGLPPIGLTGLGNYGSPRISRTEAAESMERQAERWASEAATGVPNIQDRRMINQ